jgi:hypothetical protein
VCSVRSRTRCRWPSNVSKRATQPAATVTCQWERHAAARSSKRLGNDGFTQGIAGTHCGSQLSCAFPHVTDKRNIDSFEFRINTDFVADEYCRNRIGNRRRLPAANSQQDRLSHGRRWTASSPAPQIRLSRWSPQSRSSFVSLRKANPAIRRPAPPCKAGFVTHSAKNLTRAIFLTSRVIFAARLTAKPARESDLRCHPTAARQFDTRSCARLMPPRTPIPRFNPGRHLLQLNRR